MKFKGVTWESLWVVASVVWVAAVALYGFREHQATVERLRFWADSIEWIINADPMVEVSAKELRGKLGDEQFIAVAETAYPKVNLGTAMRRYETEMAAQPRYPHPAVLFVFWALIPPVSVYAIGRLLSSAIRFRRA